MPAKPESAVDTERSRPRGYATRFATRHLTRRKNGWYLNYAVPAEYQPLLGTKYIGKTLKTSSLPEAQHRRDLELAEIKIRVEAARGNAAARTDYEQLTRKYRREFASHPADAYGEPQEMLDTVLLLTKKYGDASNAPDDDPDKLRLAAMHDARGDDPEELLGFPLPQISFREALAQYATDKATPTNKRRAERATEVLLAHLGAPDVPLKNVSRKLVISYLKSLQASYKSMTVRGWMQSLSQVVKHQIDLEQYDGQNPFLGHSIASKDVESYQPFTQKELVKVIAKIPKDDQLPAWIGYYTGARRAEITALRKKDVRYDKGSKVWYFDICEESGPKKTKASIRRVPLHPALLPAVKARLKELTEPEELLYSKRDADAFGKMFGRIKQTVLAEGDTPAKAFHSLRVMAATAFERGGVPENIAVWILGHERVASMSYGLYSKGPSLRQLVEAIRAIPKL